MYIKEQTNVKLKSLDKREKSRIIGKQTQNRRGLGDLLPNENNITYKYANGIMEDNFK